MKLRNLIAGMLALMLAGCSASSASASGSASASSAAEEKNLCEEYEELPEDNCYYYGAKEDLETFIEHGTGILVLGFPGCPWCQAYLPILNEVLQENEAEAMYYNIRVDKDEDRPFYDEVAELITSINDSGEEIIQYDNDGKQVIYMPLVLFIENGRIAAFNNETSMISSDEQSPQDYWTEDAVASLKQTLDAEVKNVKAAQEANDAKGCDTGCEVKPQGSSD